MTVKSCENLEKSQVALTVEVDAKAFEAAVEKAYLKMRGEIRVKGFRPGKATRKVIEGMYGTSVFYEEAINIAMPEAYEEAVKEKELKVVGYPKVELEGEVTKDGFTFKATVPVYPEVTLGQYKGLEAPRAVVEVTEADVDAKIKELSDRNTRLVSVDREVKTGDTAIIDFEGFDNGVPFEGGKGENFNLEIGSNSFVPGFEDQIVGMKAGEEKDIDITFPKDYQEDLAGKAVVFHVKVNEVKQKDVPALDDEFAKDVSEFDTLEELKADLKKKVTEEREEAAKHAFEDALMAKVAENMTCDVPEAMIEAQVNQFVQNFQMQLQQQGIPYDQYLKITGMDENKVREDAKEPAERQVRLDLAMTAISDTEKVEATDEEIEKGYQDLSDKYGMDLESVKKYIPKAQMEDQVKTGKVIAIVVDSATATEPVVEKAEDESKKKPAAKKKTTTKKTAAKKAEGDEADKKPAKKTATKKTTTKKTAAKKADDDVEKPVKKTATKKTTKKSADSE